MEWIYESHVAWDPGDRGRFTFKEGRTSTRVEFLRSRRTIRRLSSLPETEIPVRESFVLFRWLTRMTAQVLQWFPNLILVSGYSGICSVFNGQHAKDQLPYFVKMINSTRPLLYSDQVLKSRVHQVGGEHSCRSTFADENTQVRLSVIERQYGSKCGDAYFFISIFNTINSRTTPC